jgi:hypothetical protein
MAMEWGDLIITPSMTACPPTRRGFPLFLSTEGLDREWPCSESFLVTNINILQETNANVSLLKEGSPERQRKSDDALPRGREREIKQGELNDSYSSFFLPYFFLNRSILPAVSRNFCFPVKKGWQLEQISTRISFWVLLVSKVAPQAHLITVSKTSGWIPFFI